MTGPANPLDALRNPNSTLNELASIAQSHPQLRREIVNHPQATPEFRQWVSGLPNTAPAATGPAAATPTPAGAGAAPFPSTSGAAGGSRGVGRFLLGALAGILVGALVVGTLWMTTGSRPGAAEKMEGPGFASAEEAAMAYVEGLRDKDPDRMMSAFAIESYVDACYYEGLLRRFMFLQPHEANCKFPNDDPAGHRLNVQSQYSTVQSTVSRTFSTVVAPGLWNDATTLRFEDEAHIERFLEEVRDDFDRYDMSQISDVRAADPSEFIEGWNPFVLETETFTMGLKPTGELSHELIVFNVDGDQWAFSPVAAELNGRWYLIEPVGPIAWSILVDSPHGSVFQLED